MLSLARVLLNLHRYADLTFFDLLYGLPSLLDTLFADERDRFLHLQLLPLFSPRHVPTALATLRQTLFPNLSMPPPSVPPSSPSEALEMKRTCALSLLSLLPPFVLSRAFPGLDEEGRVKEIERELDVWGDSYLNKHLLYAMVELVIVRILPEVAERGVREGMEARGVL